MGGVQQTGGYPSANLEAIRRQGYRLLEHFTLPQSAWWESYYHPMQVRIADLRFKYRSDLQAQAHLDEEEVEIEIYRKY